MYRDVTPPWLRCDLSCHVSVSFRNIFLCCVAVTNRLRHPLIGRGAESSACHPWTTIKAEVDWMTGLRAQDGTLRRVAEKSHSQRLGNCGHCGRRFRLRSMMGKV